MTGTKVDAYLDELQAALEVRDTNDDQITDIIRQARNHLIDTGENPYETFGNPRDYAKQYAPHSTPPLDTGCLSSVRWRWPRAVGGSS
ncbi:hypothetical protein G7067_02850 [Leucobacter insecticola]|uniref:Uncharacterized protein n=1 Tax=Leucobacter insecticola TaxID=2714934 RepID=A0A6G8FH36_9MICO|nr:hypothetical protein [Leucobacter insecticola]QIM15593.1 hypothetical protein G7067_02850 [Leucobacter insecticola]